MCNNSYYISTLTLVAYAASYSVIDDPLNLIIFVTYTNHIPYRIR